MWNQKFGSGTCNDQNWDGYVEMRFGGASNLRIWDLVVGYLYGSFEKNFYFLGKVETSCSRGSSWWIRVFLKFKKCIF